MQRCFIACELLDASRVELQRSIEPFKSKTRAERPRFVDPGHFHVTLKFLGSIKHQARVAIETALEQALVGVPPIETRWAGFGGLPRRAQAHVLCAVLGDDTGELSALHAGVERLCVEAGSPAETRDFKPHVTLARFHKAVDLRPYLALSPPPGSVLLASVALFESELATGGAKYRVLSRYALEAPPSP